MIPLDKLIALQDNKYIFSRAAMLLVDRAGNIKGVTSEDESWKIVPKVLEMLLNDELKYKLEKNK